MPFPRMEGAVLILGVGGSTPSFLQKKEAATCSLRFKRFNKQWPKLEGFQPVVARTPRGHSELILGSLWGLLQVAKLFCQFLTCLVNSVISFCIFASFNAFSDSNLRVVVMPVARRSINRLCASSSSIMSAMPCCFSSSSS